MTANVTTVTALSEAEIFRAFCELEREELGETNREFMFFAHGVPLNNEAIHNLMTELGEEAMESASPFELLRQYKSHLERCARQLEEVIEQATHHRAMAREIVMLVNRKHRIRVAAVSTTGTN
jgi:hypothetical protein